MKNKNIVIFIIALAILGTIGAFDANFHNSNISENISDWGNFGGYIGEHLVLYLSSLFIIHIVNSLK